MSEQAHTHPAHDEETPYKALPLVYTSRKILFPHCTIELDWHSRYQNMNQGDLLIIMPVFHPIRDYILHRNTFCTLAKITRIDNRPDQKILEVKGLRRVIITRRQRHGKALWHGVPELFREPEGLTEHLRKRAQEFVFLINIQESDRLIYLMTFITALTELSDFVAHYFILDPKRRRVLFFETNPEKRTETLIRWLDEMIRDIQKKQQGNSIEKKSSR